VNDHIIDTRYLTKSRFALALTCPTKLFYTGKPEYPSTLAEDDFMQALAEGGFQVGELAKCYHPGGHDVKSLDYETSLKETNELLAQDRVTIYEAAIQTGDFIIRTDVLIKTGNSVDLIEVKAKSFWSEAKFFDKKGFITRSWRPYLYDVAFQFWVMQQAFPDWTITPYLMLADKTKAASVDGLNQLFLVTKDADGNKNVSTSCDVTAGMLGDEILTKVDVSRQVQMILNGEDIPPERKFYEDTKGLAARANEYADYYKRNQRYPIAISAKCKSCEFNNANEPSKRSGYAECWSSVYPGFDQHVPHIFDIWNFRKSAKLLERDIYYQQDLISDSGLCTELNERQLMQVSKTVGNDKTELVDPDLFRKMDRWVFPLHFIDFETCMVAIPFNKVMHPYDQIAFQFSCHTLHEDGRVTHDEWINSERGVFPNFDFVRNLKLVLEQDEGTIFRYAAHENTVLRQIHKQLFELQPDGFWDLMEWIDTITHRTDAFNNKLRGPRNMVDMLRMVQKYYYHPLMGGSNSIKSVLPAVFSSSEYIRQRYSSKVGFGKNLHEQVLWQLDPNTNMPFDPYKLLPDKQTGIDFNQEKIMLDDGAIQQGAAALVAYAKMQFSEMSAKERASLIAALLQYCELDTLAMLMIYEHWGDVRRKG